MSEKGSKKSGNRKAVEDSLAPVPTVPDVMQPVKLFGVSIANLLTANPA